MTWTFCFKDYETMRYGRDGNFVSFFLYENCAIYLHEKNSIMNLKSSFIKRIKYGEVLKRRGS